MKSVVQAIPRMRSSGLVWLILRAVVFLLGSASFNGSGMKQLADLGVGCAIAANAVIIAFFS